MSDENGGLAGDRRFFMELRENAQFRPLLRHDL